MYVVCISIYTNHLFVHILDPQTFPSNKTKNCIIQAKLGFHTSVFCRYYNNVTKSSSDFVAGRTIICVDAQSVAVAQRGSRVIALLFNLGSKWGWAANAMAQAPVALLTGKRPGTHSSGEWVGPRAGLCNLYMKLKSVI